MTSGMADVISHELWVRELPQSFQSEFRAEGGAAVLFLLRQAIDTFGDASSNDFKRFIDEAYDRAWERLHCGRWKNVHGVWRRAFGFASILKAQHSARERLFKESLKALDMCLMMAGPYAAPQVHKMIANVEQAMKQSEGGDSDEDPTNLKRRRVDLPDRPYPTKPLPRLAFPIQRITMPSLDTFYSSYMMTDTPVILTGAMDLWPAMGKEDSSRSWQTLAYFRRIAGHRTVPVEVGSSYLEDDWSQQLLTVNEFIDRFLKTQNSISSDSESPRVVGYLAQHHLFDQIPALGRDIMTPDYCTLERNEDGDNDVAVNAWFGPEGTVSPLHFDPKDNLLCQVVGKKYLRLFAPSESDKLYPVEGLLSNTSQVRVEEPDLDEFPRFADAKYIECVLEEGEMLYIPPRYWHFVRSLSTSFSVSFWWS